jgi:hypothetical protein
MISAALQAATAHRSAAGIRSTCDVTGSHAGTATGPGRVRGLISPSIAARKRRHIGQWITRFVARV